MTLVNLDLSPSQAADDPTPTPIPYQCLGKYLYFPNKDQQDWWDTVGLMLSKFLINSKYDVHQQYQYLTLFAQHIIPFLGPLPTSQTPVQYKSLMGGGRTLEISQNFQESKRTVRFSFEPVNHLSGTARDPFNQLAADELLGHLQKLGLDMDLQLYRQFVNDIGLNTKEKQTLFNIPNFEKVFPVRAQNFIALDLVDGDVKVKCYMSAIARSLLTGARPSSVFFHALSSILGNEVLREPFSMIKSYIEERAALAPPPTDPPSPPDIDMNALSCDLGEPSKSRFKLYLYTLEVTLASACDMWTLGGRLQGPDITKGLEIVRRLWSIFNIKEGRRQVPDGSRNDPTHVPLMFNFETKPGVPHPQPKIYLPLTGMTDRENAEAMVTFFQEHGWDEQARDYMDNMADYYPTTDLDQTCDLQNWLSFSYTEATGIYMTMYYTHPFDV